MIRSGGGAGVGGAHGGGSERGLRGEAPGHVVRVVTAEPLQLVVVRRTLRADELQGVWPKALDEVWGFVRRHGLKAGRNVMVYRGAGAGTMALEAGVEVFRPVPADENVFGSETPGGPAVMVEHWGSYDGIPRAHEAIRRHCEAEGLALAGTSWEVYGHYPSDQTLPLTEVFYALVG